MKNKNEMLTVFDVIEIQGVTYVILGLTVNGILAYSANTGTPGMLKEITFTQNFYDCIKYIGRMELTEYKETGK